MTVCYIHPVLYSAIRQRRSLSLDFVVTNLRRSLRSEDSCKVSAPRSHGILEIPCEATVSGSCFGQYRQRNDSRVRPCASGASPFVLQICRCYPFSRAGSPVHAKRKTLKRISRIRAKQSRSLPHLLGELNLVSSRDG